LHEGQQYYVQELNLETHTAALIPVARDYYTEPQRQTEVSLITDLTPSTSASIASARQFWTGTDSSSERRGEHCSKGYGEMQITTQVTGFRKRQWFTGENLGDEPLDLPPTEFQTTGYWLSLSDETIETLRAAGAWTNDPNQYGPAWPRLRDAVRARDGYRCQVCGLAETSRQHDVHHKVPLRALIRSATTPVVASQSQPIFHAPDALACRQDRPAQLADRPEKIARSAITRANQMDNLITLCPACHRKVEANVRIRSGLAGLGYVLGQLAPLFLMCDPGDLGIFTDPAWAYAENLPSVVLYDLVPAGIGFSQKLYEMHDELLAHAEELIRACGCADGCPSCVGPAGENGMGGKQETLAILRELSVSTDQKIGETGIV
jgi:DEAD/DEAH box helicase domain-containing protein